MIKIERTKFNVDKNTESRTYDGIIFDSQLEMRYYKEVVLPLSKEGVISHFELQKKYELQPKFIHKGKTIQPINYVADFYIEYSDGHTEVIDTKGCPDSVAMLKKKMFTYHYPDAIYRWICYSKIDGGWCDLEYVKKQRKERKKQKQLQKEIKEK